ncbi:MAG TPA: hypothetical protein VED41_01860 [Solirubrobacteraceae bacterium]|nr:hypothetical protein [Solirubrobacteraceae bacterium]
MARGRPGTLTVRVSGDGRSLDAVACSAGEDLVVLITGGSRPHVGCVVVARSHPSSARPDRRSVTSSVLAAPPHREEALARPLAELLARTRGGTVIIAAGVHDDNLSPEGIAAYLRLGERLGDALLQALNA